MLLVRWWAGLNILLLISMLYELWLWHVNIVQTLIAQVLMHNIPIFCCAWYLCYRYSSEVSDRVLCGGA